MIGSVLVPLASARGSVQLDCDTCARLLSKAVRCLS
jgi:hypothetical protein